MTEPSSSTSARFRPPAIHQVKVEGFFGTWIETLAATTVHTLLDRCIQAGMLDQIDPARPNPGLRIPFQGGNSTVSTQMFWDSDFGKSIEAASYTLARHPDPALEAKIDEIIDAYARLQAEDGYLNSWYLRIEPGKRWTNLRDCHELYNAGHLMEGAVAYFHATGKRRFLDIMARYADYLCSIFGTGAGQMRGYCGHPEVELALVKLGRATGEQRYIDLARFFIDQRGQAPHYYDAEAAQRGDDPKDYYFGSYEYSQSHEPVRDQRRVVGHAVRAAYLYAGMADVATEFADHTLTPALGALWDHLTKKNLYVTGGFGPSAHNEGLTFDYDLPNATAYAETCAAVALVFWASRMLGLGPNRRYADIMERALYNGALVGLSRDGTRFFYDNPLESRGAHHRWIWHHCPCCPPNIARLIASIGTYAYGLADDGIAIHLYVAGEASLALPGGPVRVRLETRYPEDGQIAITLLPEIPQTFTLSLRLPEWAQGATLTLNGEPAALTDQVQDGYIQLRRQWQAGDRLELDLAMPVRRLHAAPEVGANQGRVTLMRGPLVYCLEEQDNGPALNSIRLNSSGLMRCDAVDELGGIVTLAVEAVRERPDKEEDLYTTNAKDAAPVTVRAIPYYAWDNRMPGEMLVWLREC
ncbi:glycoside hydrolase family 127 protein [Acidisoma cellulosilytica]|uniref:Glycoside hydrolase family 127 protein n=1 Tax=Acidisoma cellulosilyticum TaxID=2802395 RepID=A0A964E609_9PROT|nr:beta-L-arabinofuranosidase domain-containing protein [Acidisoma cellulosilyticum]MCB8883109.1 glycoside hydrolase family 127 protein [Acidisoma cellulosilyticum]